jgi:hypothetical protein
MAEETIKRFTIAHLNALVDKTKGPSREALTMRKKIVNGTYLDYGSVFQFILDNADNIDFLRKCVKGDKLNCDDENGTISKAIDDFDDYRLMAEETIKRFTIAHLNALVDKTKGPSREALTMRKKIVNGTYLDYGSVFQFILDNADNIDFLRKCVKDDKLNCDDENGTISKAIDDFDDYKELTLTESNTLEMDMSDDDDNLIDRLKFNPENDLLSQAEQAELGKQFIMSDMGKYLCTKQFKLTGNDDETNLSEFQMCIFICLYLENIQSDKLNPELYKSVNIGFITNEKSLIITQQIIELLKPTDDFFIYDGDDNKLCKLVFWYNWWYNSTYLTNKPLSVQIPENILPESNEKDSGKSSHYIKDNPLYKIYKYFYQKINIYLSILLEFNASFYKGLNITSNSIDNYLLEEEFKKQPATSIQEVKMDEGKYEVKHNGDDNDDDDDGSQVARRPPLLQLPANIDKNIFKIPQANQIENFHILMLNQNKTTLYEYVNKDAPIMNVANLVIPKIIMKPDGSKLILKSSGLIKQCLKTAVQNLEFKKTYLLLLVGSEIQDDEFKTYLNYEYGTFFHVYEILQYFYLEIFEHFEEINIAYDNYCSILEQTLKNDVAVNDKILKERLINNILNGFINIKNLLEKSLNEFSENDYETIIGLIQNKVSEIKNKVRLTNKKRGKKSVIESRSPSGPTEYNLSDDSQGDIL